MAMDKGEICNKNNNKKIKNLSQLTPSSTHEFYFTLKFILDNIFFYFDSGILQ